MKIVSILLATILSLAATEKASSKLVIGTAENFKSLLGPQLSTEIQDPKKHKPLLLALVSREHSGTLEFGREFSKLADTVHRQFSLALSDCHFEKEICDHFMPPVFPAMYLVKEGKIHLYNKHSDNFTQEILLDFLSSDNYLRQSSVAFDDSDEFVRTVLGVGGSFTDRLYNNYGRSFETWIGDVSKHSFKKLGLGHWNRQVQTGLALVVIMVPVCFLITLALAYAVILSFNFVNKMWYDQKLKKLTDRRDDLVRQLSEINGKKAN